MSMATKLACMVILGAMATAFPVMGRSLGSQEELREQRLVILRKIIDDLKDLIYVNDLYEDGKVLENQEPDLGMYLETLSNSPQDKRVVPGGFSAVRGKRPHVFSAVRGKRPHTFSAVRGKRDPPRFMADSGLVPGWTPFGDDSGKRNAPAPSGFSYVRGKKSSLSPMDTDEAETENEIVSAQDEDAAARDNDFRSHNRS